MDSKYIVAIEIGSSKIKGAVGTFGPDNTLSVVAVEEEKLVGDDLADAVRYGLIQNVEKVAMSVDRIRRRLESSPSVNPRNITGVYVALGGRSLFAIPAEVSREYPEEVEITDEFIAQLRREAQNSNPTDKDVVGVTPTSFSVNNSLNANPVGVFARTVKGNFMLITCKSSATRNLKRVLQERLNLNINGYIVRPIAEANLVLSEEEKRLGCMLIDFGAETITVVIYKGGVLRYLATLPLGSRNITRDLMSLNYTEERADDIKRSSASVNSDDPAAKRPEAINNQEINNLVSARVAEIIANISEQITYADLQASDLPKGIILVGGGAKLRGFSNALANYTKLPVRVGSHQGLLRIADSHIQPNEAVDVLAILTEAVRGGDARECTVRTVDDTASIFDTPDDNTPDDGESRIGSDLIGNKKKEKKEKKKSKAEKAEPFTNDAPDDDTPAKSRWGAWRERLGRILSDEEDNDGYTN